MPHQALKNRGDYGNVGLETLRARHDSRPNPRIVGSPMPITLEDDWRGTYSIFSNL